MDTFNSLGGSSKMDTFNPLDSYIALANTGYQKSQEKLFSTILKGFLGGAYIAIGSVLALRVAGGLSPEVWGSLQKLIFAGVFPVGLAMILIAGADLFTSNCSYLSASFYCKQVKSYDVIKSWVLSWSTNFIGALFVIIFMSYMTGLFFETSSDGQMPFANYAVKLANGKTSLGWLEAFLRAIGCNWMVCMAVYMSLNIHTAPGKIITIWAPTTAFVAIGWEHCIANMAFVPLGIFIGSDPVYLEAVGAGLASPLTANWSNFFIDNLVPVTLGNIVGGAIFISAFYYAIHYDKLIKKSKNL